MTDFKSRKADISLIYKTVSRLELPLKVFLPDTDVHKAGCTVFIHGGSWLDAICENGEWNGGWLADSARYFAAHGFVGIVISYRSLKISDSLNIDGLLGDCQAAVRFIMAHFGFADIGKTVYIGESAGGYLVARLALGEYELRPAAAVMINPVLGSFDAKWSYAFKGCSPRITEMAETSGKCPEMLFLHGDADTITDIGYTRDFCDRLTHAGKSCELWEIPGAQHAFALYGYRSPDEFVTQITDRIIDWIKSRTE